MTICLPISVFADKPRFLPMLEDTQSRVYADMESIKNHPHNPNLLVYDVITNFDDTDKDLAGTSMIEKHYLDCLNRIDIMNPEPAKLYSSSFREREIIA